MLTSNGYRAESDWRSDRALAYGLLRFFFGVNLATRGIARMVLGIDAFIAYMLKQFETIPAMPHGFLVAFATVLPAIEAILGLMILVGFKTRAALIATSLLMTALTFGTMVRQDFTIAWMQLNYAIALFALLALRSWNVISVDARMRR